MRPLAFSLLLALSTPSVMACNKKVDEPPPSEFKPAQAPPLPPGPSKLEITDDAVGTGKEVKTGDKVKVHYTGTLMNGKQFDSSRDKGEPFGFTIGKGEVIKGWDEGVVGMRVGGKRRLVIPSDLGYGPSGHGDSIPKDAGLKFEVELVAIEGDAPDAGVKTAAKK